jgi:fatty-acyl-CoA synthase
VKAGSVLPSAESICGFAGIREAVVYGVEVPGYDGRPGMATIVADSGLDLKALRSYLATRLPDYARPVFLRLAGAIDVTGTFKQRKLSLVKEGYDPAQSADPIYVDDREQRAYVRLDDALYQRVTAGGFRL